MKKLSLLLLVLMLSLFVSAQIVEQTYHFENPVVTEIQSYNQVQFENCMQTAVTGNPTLPYKSVSLLLPFGSEAESVEVILSDFEEINVKSQLYPYQASLPYSKPERKSFAKNEDVYSSKNVYPSKCHGELSTHYLNGHAFAFTSFSPVQYEPSSGKVRYAKTATVRIELASAKRDNSSMIWNTPYINSKVASLADNPEMIDSYKTRGRNIAAYDMLIITGDEYVEGFAEYCEYYNGIGVRNRIATVNDIYASSEGIDNQEKIRNYIIKEYSDNGIIMVLLGGDVNIVPYRGLYCHVQSSSVYEDNGIPADLYFSALDGTWNDNGNNRWGEIGEDDLLPEIGIARMSFNNATKQANIINKTLKYQREPVLGEFRDVTLAGEWLYDNPETWGSDYMELLIGERSDNGYTTIGIPEDYNFTRHYAEDGTWGPTQLKNTINNGTQYVHHVGHANTNTVAEWYNSDITDANFSGANGIDHNYTFFHSHGCVCGSFDDDCIMERMITIQNFAVAAIGNSRYGWFNEGQTEGPAPHLHREMTDAQYHERIPFLGMHLSESKCQTAPFVNAPGQWEEGALRWNFYDINILGDVAIRPWLDEPFDANIEYDAQLFIGCQSTEIVVKDEDGNPQKGFYCSYVFDDERVGFAITDENGVAEVNFEGGLTATGDMKLYITGLNAFPVVLDVTAVPNNSAYVVYEEYTVNDANGIIEYNESSSFDMVLKNIGSVNASNVTATLTCDKTNYINITSPNYNVGNVSANSDITLEDAFAFTVCDSVPNNSNVRFFISCTDGTDTWESKFDVNIFAPEFEIVKPNGLELNPGDSETVEFTIINKGGSSASNINFSILLPEEISMNQSQFNIPSLDAGEETDIEVTLTVSENAALGYAYEMPFTVSSGRYSVNGSYAIIVGNVTEDFESGDFSKFDWEFDGNPNWEIATDEAYEGQYCAKSGAIGDQTSTTLKITIDVKAQSEFSFYKKVSSESGYDFLKFYIDGQEKDKWSGEDNWSEESFILTEGLRTLEWTYSKDVYAEDGQDCAWIDNIKFPPTAVIVDVETVEEKDITIYPNPAKDFVKVSTDNEQQTTVKIYNTLGMLVGTRLATSATNEIEINVSEYNPGIYFINISNEKYNVTKKIVIE